MESGNDSRGGPPKKKNNDSWVLGLESQLIIFAGVNTQVFHAQYTYKVNYIKVAG